MTRWFDLHPVDETFFGEAWHVSTYTARTHSDPDRTWAEIAGPDPLSWVRVLDCGYLSPEPHGIGARREASILKGLLRLREHFFEWDDSARRHSFYATAASLPLFSAFAEDYRVTPTDDGILFTWTVAFDPAPKTRLLLAT